MPVTSKTENPNMDVAAGRVSPAARFHHGAETIENCDPMKPVRNTISDVRADGSDRRLLSSIHTNKNRVITPMSVR